MKLLGKYKSLIIALVGILVFAFGLCLFIQSYEFYQDEWGTDISFNEDYIICMVVGIIITTYGLVKQFKNVGEKAYLLTGGLITLIVGCYSIGTFFKQLFKAIEKSKAFDYASYQVYLYIGLITFIIFVYFLVSYLTSKSHDNAK